MKIQAALALSLMYTEGNSERVRESFNTALNLAQRHDDARLHLSLLSGMSMYLHGLVDAAGTYELALRGVAAARKTGNPDDAAIADSMLGAAYCLRSDQSRAQEHLKRVLQGLPHPRRFNASQYLFDLRSSSLSVLTNSFFFSGNFDQAADCAKMNIEAATRSAHPIGLCRAFTNSMRLYFWTDNLEQIEHSLAKLEHTAERYSLAPARAVALGMRGRYLVRIGRIADGIRHLQESLEKLTVSRYDVVTSDLVSELAVSLARQDARPEAIALIDRSNCRRCRDQQAASLARILPCERLGVCVRAGARQSPGRAVFREGDDAGAGGISVTVRIAGWIGTRAYLDRARRSTESP
jgi:tetratricopeptide (TPR) repeat protein